MVVMRNTLIGCGVAGRLMPAPLAAIGDRN
jgi:hypothetical protein